MLGECEEFCNIRTYCPVINWQPFLFLYQLGYIKIQDGQYLCQNTLLPRYNAMFLVLVGVQHYK